MIRRNPHGTPAEIALLRYMEWWSEENWCAGWIINNEHYMRRDDTEAFPWLVEQAGGWWTWDDGPVFVCGSINDLEPAPPAGPNGLSSIVRAMEEGR